MKPLYLKLSKFLILSLAVILVLSACSSNAGGNNQNVRNSSNIDVQSENDGQSQENEQEKDSVEQVTVEFWHAYGEGEEKVLLEEVIPQFEEQHANIKINATRMPTENLEQQVITAVAGGSAPDLMRMDIVWVPRFAREGALQSVDDLPGFDEIAANSYEAPLSTNMYDGQHYGIPLDTNTKVAIYNKELLNEAGATEPPQTMDELVELARNLKEKGKFGITIGGPNTWDFPPYFWTLGGTITDEQFTKASGYLNSDASVKALETIISWNEEGLLAPPILGGQPGTWEGLRGEGDNPPTYMMINDGPWFFSILGDEVKDTMIPAVMPAGPDGQSHSIVGGQNLVIFEGAKHPEEAWVFAQFMHSEDIQELMAVKTGQFPTNKNVADSEQLKKVYYFDAYAKQLETAYPRTPSADWNKISEVLETAFEKAIRLEATPQQALDEAAKQIDDILQNS